MSIIRNICLHIHNVHNEHILSTYKDDMKGREGADSLYICIIYIYIYIEREIDR